MDLPVGFVQSKDEHGLTSEIEQSFIQFWTD